MNRNINNILIDADSELSAQAHGREAVGRDELAALARRARDAYEGHARKMRQQCG